VISLDVATDRLLHWPSYRQAFLDGHYEQLDLSPEDLEDLSSLDHEQLIETAEAVRSSLLQRKHRGSGGIQATYPQTIAAWQSQHEDPSLTLFLDRFMESEAFESYREVPNGVPGLSMEEAVYRFFDSRNVGDPAVREHEFLAGLCKALALNSRPFFTVGPPLRRAPAGWFAVSSHPPTSLFAAVQGRYIQGEVTPFLAEVLTSERAPERVAEDHDVPEAVAAAARAKFTGLGLL